GMGDSLEGILRYLRHERDTELSDFLNRMDRTYASYQHPGGFFLSATGWDSEVDIAPSTAWHAHDFRYLSERFDPEPDFWDRFFSENTRTSVLLGRQCLWVERGLHWMIDDYFWQDVFRLRGRKDDARFGRDMGWVGGAKALPENFLFPDPPVFLKDESGVYLKSGKESEIDIRSMSGLEYQGLF
ncbi:MAG: hypothetical protein JNM63_08905, partial [Spirochaetia bacterium]|nr:hypothetical protein [Spirochaetia bacterium]